MLKTDKGNFIMISSAQGKQICISNSHKVVIMLTLCFNQEFYGTVCVYAAVSSSCFYKIRSLLAAVAQQHCSIYSIELIITES